MASLVQTPPGPTRNTFTPAEAVSASASAPQGVFEPRGGPGDRTSGNAPPGRSPVPGASDGPGAALAPPAKLTAANATAAIVTAHLTVQRVPITGTIDRPTRNRVSPGEREEQDARSLLWEPHDEGPGAMPPGPSASQLHPWLARCGRVRAGRFHP